MSKFREFERELTPEEVKRFFSLVKFNNESGCWEFSNGRKDRYGKFGWNGWTPNAHRIAWFHYRGDPLDKQLHHLCGFKGCVNPVHLFPLTTELHSAIHQMETTHCGSCNNPYDHKNTYIYPDTFKKECMHCRRLRDRPRSQKKWLKEKETYTNSSEMRDFASKPKLDWDQVREIRRLYATGEWSQRKLARKYKVSQPLVGMIVRGEAWKEDEEAM